MTKRELQRQESLLPNGIPKKVRIYDNGGTLKDGTIDRITVVFTGNYNNIGWKPRGKVRRDNCHPVVGMSETPFHPQGFCIHNTYPNMIDRPTYSHLGRKIKFEDLNEDCQKVVLADYKELWNLKISVDITPNL